MNTFDRGNVRGPFSFLGWVASAICIASLLAAPFVRAHDFAEHFRGSEARRETIRLISLENAPVQGAERAARTLPAWNRILPMVIDPQFKTLVVTSVVPSIPTKRMLMRYRLRVSGLSDPDPLS